MPVFSGKLADVFGKIWACFFSYIRHVLFAHWKILSLIRTFFRSSAQYTFSANRQDIYFLLASIASIFHSPIQYTSSTNRKTYIFGSLA